MSKNKITKVNLSRKRNWLSPGWHSIFELTAELDGSSASIAIDALSRLLAAQLANARELIDLKGADSGIYQGGSGPLIRVAGNCFLPAEPDQEVREKEPFSLELNTQYKEFNLAGSIVHTTKLERKGPLPHSIPLKNIGRVFPLDVEQFEVGIDFYKTKRYPLVGVSPVVTETLKIKCTKNQLELSIDADQLQTKETLPLARWGLFDDLSKILAQSFALDLRANYR